MTLDKTFLSQTGREVSAQFCGNRSVVILVDGEVFAAISSFRVSRNKLANMAREAARRLACDLGHAARYRRNRKARKGAAE